MTERAHVPWRATRARVTAALTAACAVAWAAVPGVADASELDQEISGGQQIATDPAVLSDGHVDIGPHYVDDEWTLLVHDDTGGASAWRRMDSTVFRVGDAALLDVPDSDAYSFLPADPGDRVHVLPQAQQSGVVWLGWNTQDPAVMEDIDRGATLRLRGVQGPGEMVMFLQSGNLSEPDVLWDSREAYPQQMWVEVNTHTHANWVFSEPGVYLVEVEVTADVVTGGTESDTRVLRFAVGDGTATDEAMRAEYAGAPASETEPQAGTAQGDGGSDAGAGADETAGSSDGIAPGVLIASGAAVVLVVAVVIGVLRGRAVRKRAELERAARGTPGREGGP